MSDERIPSGFRARVLRNTVFGAGGRLIGLAVTFFLTPYIVHRLGTDGYALYALAAVVSGYLGLLDLGLGTGYVKYVAEAAAHHDDDGVNEVLSTGFYAYLAFGGCLVALWLLGSEVLLSALGIAPALRSEARLAFTISVVILACSGAAAAFRAVLYGLQHIDVASKIGVALIIPKVVLVVAVLEGGLGLVGLVLADLALFLAGTIALAVVARRLFPALSIHPSRASRITLHRLFHYGLRLQVSRASEVVNFHLDKLLLARFVGLPMVTSYDLGARLLTTTRSFPLLLLNALVPAVSELDAHGATATIDRLAARTLRYLLLLATPAFALLAVEAPRIIELWLGPGHQTSALAIRVLAFGYLLNVLSGAFTTITQGIARNDYQMRISLLALCANLVLSVLLVRRFGYGGVLTGTLVSFVLMYLYAERSFLRLARERHPGARRVAARAYLSPAVGVLVATLLVAVLRPLVGWPGGRAAQLGVVGLEALVFAAGYLVGVVASGGIERRDIELGVEIWPPLRRLLPTRH